MNRDSLKNVRYVEDRPDMRMCATMTLEGQTGAHSRHASAVQALAKATAFGPGRLLLDVAIPCTR